MAGVISTYLDDRYIKTAGLFRSPKAKPYLYVYVESEEDVLFWRTFWDSYETYYNIIISPVQIPNRDDDTECAICGKDYSISLAIKGQLSLSPSSFICVDADYDWLIDTYHAYTEFLRNNKYIITTYWYSIENIQCHPINLHRYFYDLTFAPECKYNFEEIMANTSKLYSELLLICLISLTKKDNQYNLVSGEDSFANDLKAIQFNNGNICQETINFVHEKEKQLQAYKTDNIALYDAIKDKLNKSGFSPENYYLIMQGHAIADGVVCHLFSDIRKMWHAEYFAKQTNSELRNKHQKLIDISSQELIIHCTNVVIEEAGASINNHIEQVLTQGKILEIIDALRMQKCRKLA